MFRTQRMAYKSLHHTGSTTSYTELVLSTSEYRDRDLPIRLTAGEAGFLPSPPLADIVTQKMCMVYLWLFQLGRNKLARLNT